MSIPILTTKLYIPSPPPKAVSRSRLVEWLNEGLKRKLTLISAAAGFGKTTVVSEWAASSAQPVAWLSLEAADSDPGRFLAYFISALRTIAPGIGERVLAMIQTPQPPSHESIFTTLLNEISDLPDSFVFVLDDYHAIDSRIIDTALAYLIERLPPQMHLLIATREDPQLPLARLRARDQLAELRITDLRFTTSEASRFLNDAMGLSLSAESIAALETRTEGWIAGLQLAAISMQGHKDTEGFVKSFTGSHRFVMDYLVEEVLQQQPESVQTFLLRTSILNRMCGSLCDAVLLDGSDSGQATLDYLERSNLFILPLDNERRWYRYHHLFAELLRQRLLHGPGNERGPGSPSISELHIRASQWFESNSLEIEAFHHAVAANDIERAERLIEGKGTPLHLRGLVNAMLDWLGSLPKEVMDARPSLWVKYGSLTLVVGLTSGVEEKLAAGEAALQNAEPTPRTRALLGQIAAARATLALTRYQSEVMIAQSRRALEYLPPTSRSMRANAHWTMGYGYFLQGDRISARQAMVDAISLSQAVGDVFTLILATIGMGVAHEADNELHQAAETHRRVLQWAGDQPLQIIYEAHAGLARVLYEWNDLESAEYHAKQSLDLARQYENIIDRYIVCEVFLARVKLAHGDVDGAATMLSETAQTARRQSFVFRVPEVAAAQVPVLLRQGNVAAAAHLAHTFKLSLSQARVLLAQGDTAGALALLGEYRQQMEAKGWQDERLKAMLLQGMALHAHGEKSEAVRVIGEALALTAPEGFVRSFIDEGPPMARLLADAASHRIMPDYTAKLLALFEAESQDAQANLISTHESLIEPLSQRELEVLQLIAQGLSNHEISEKLFLALSTVKGHIQRIFEKLQVQRRTEAVVRARELGLL